MQIEPKIESCDLSAASCLAVPSTTHAGVRRYFHAILAVLLCCALVLLVGGCRYSDVLIDKIVDQQNGTLDESLEPIAQETNDASKVRDDLVSSTESKSENKTEQQSDLPSPGNVDSQASVGKGVSGNNGSGDGENSDAAAPSGNNSDKDAEDDAEDDDPNDSSIDNEGNPVTPPENKPKNQGNQTSGNGGNTSIYDDEGYKKELPHVGHIAATGQYAVIVQMVGGKSALAAADADCLASLKSSGAFEGEGVEKVNTGWSGDGTDADEANVKAIRSSGAQVVLIPRGSSTLSEKQISSLGEKITVVYMPALGKSDTSDTDITKAVQVIGEILKADTGNKSASMADRYVAFHDKVINECKSRNGGYSYKSMEGTSYEFIYQGSDRNKGTGSATKQAIKATAYIDSWLDYSGTYTAQQSWLSYKGGMNGKKVDLDGGVGLSAKGKNAFNLYEYYLQASGVMDSCGKTPGNYWPGKRQAIIPCNVKGGIKGSELAAFTTNGSYPLHFRKGGGQGTTASEWTDVGDSFMPGVMARTEKIAKKLVASANSSNGFYHTGKSYKVYVVPEGIAGSWARGTVESCLLSAWAQCQIAGKLGTSDYKSYVSDFYKTFYRCDLDKAVEAKSVKAIDTVLEAG